MNVQHAGTMIARAAGLVLIIIGVSALFNLFQFFASSGLVTSGWSSSGTTPAQDLSTQLHDTYYVVSSTAAFYVPSAAQAITGLVMIMLSKPIGRWLAKGLGGEGSA